MASLPTSLPNPLLPPLNVPVFTPQGKLTPAWQWYLYQVFTTANSQQDAETLGAFDSGATDSGESAATAANSKLIVLAGDPAKDYGAAIDDLRKLIWSTGETISPRRLDALETLIWTLSGDIGPPALLTGLDALRLLTPALPNTQFFATDTQLLYEAVAGAWVVVKATSTPPGAWSSFTPTVTPGGTMTFTPGTGGLFGKYQEIGKTVNFRGSIVGAIGGTLSPDLSIALPTQPLDNSFAVACSVDSGTPQAASTWPATTKFLVNLPGHVNYSAGAIGIGFAGSYEGV